MYSLGISSNCEWTISMHEPAISGCAITWLAMVNVPAANSVHACLGCRYFPLDTAALITRSEFLHGVQQLKQHSADPWSIVKHQSSKQLNEDKFRHRRPVPDPQRCFQRPMISQQVSLQASTCKQCLPSTHHALPASTHHAGHSGSTSVPGNSAVKVALEYQGEITEQMLPRLTPGSTLTTHPLWWLASGHLVQPQITVDPACATASACYCPVGVWDLVGGFGCLCTSKIPLDSQSVASGRQMMLLDK